MSLSPQMRQLAALLAAGSVQLSSPDAASSAMSGKTALMVGGNLTPAPELLQRVIADAKTYEAPFIDLTGLGRRTKHNGRRNRGAFGRSRHQ